MGTKVSGFHCICSINALIIWCLFAGYFVGTQPGGSPLLCPTVQSMAAMLTIVHLY